MSGIGYGTQFTPKLCFCGHDLVVHTPNCTICPAGHPFSSDPVSQATSQTGGGANANGQRGG